MEGILAAAIVAAAVFGICFLLDKLFQKLFRKQQQFHSGLSVRLNKRYASVGLILGLLGLVAVFSGLTNGWVLIVGGSLVILVGAALVVYYVTFGVFYDDESFLIMSFGKPKRIYRYAEIRAQQLYVAGGSVVIELYLSDGESLQLQSTMDGTYSFMDKAFRKWLEQTGRKEEDCVFYDPDNSCWFPTPEE